MEDLIKERNTHGNFTDIFDFIRRMSGVGLNRRMLENLIKSGALDCLEPQRELLLNSIGLLLSVGQLAQSEKESQQSNMFDDADSDAVVEIDLPSCEEWSAIERLSYEAEAVGFYLSGHPLEDYTQAFKNANILSFKDLETSVQTEVKIAGTVLKIDERKSKRGNSFAFLTLSDPVSQFEVVVFSDVLLSISEWG